MKLNFSHRIIGSFLIMASLSILVGSFAFMATSNLQRSSRAIMKENVSSLKAAEELELAMLIQKGFVSSYFLDGNPSWLKTLEEKKKDFDIWFQKAQEVALTENEKKILRDIFTLYTAYDSQRDQAVRMYQSGDMEEAKRFLLADVRETVDNLYQKCEELILANEILIAKAEVASQKNVAFMQILIWAAIGITLCLGIFLGFFVARKINEQFVRSAKMASLGQLSANIAHEVRNPLTSIKMRLYSLGQELKSSPPAKEDIQVISEEINRMEKTVKNFLDFARPPVLNLQACDIINILERTINLVHMKASAQNVRIEKKFEAQHLEVTADKEQMRQVFLNIILNGIESMPEGGALEITLSQNKDKRGKNFIVLAFKDEGLGITPEDKTRLFEPFFTTKTDGTGLGLFIASRIIQMHKGKINIENQEGRGVVVTVVLPAGKTKKG